uniref:Defensin n=1 Tax=Harpalus rufipes TaxID=247442 RepID=A0A9E8M9N8_HARRU|nr:defensin [Harpalus rufipes]
MAKLLVALFVLSLCIFAYLAAPLDEAEEGLVRQRRFTCDLLSFEAKGSVSLNHSACALHCIALRKKGGSCNNKAVCICRR